MQRLFKYFFCRAGFDYFAQIHDRNAVTYTPNRGQVVTDEQVGNAEVMLKIG